jgi:AcrR family transcriptional regulator
MSNAKSTLRADARRNREAILSAAGELFAERGSSAQMEEIAERADLGMGTLYRHFATKQQLLGALVERQFLALGARALEIEKDPDPISAFDSLTRDYLQTAAQDAAFRAAVLGPEHPAWKDLAAQKADFRGATERILARAADAGYVREDLTFMDFIQLTRGVMANMVPGGDWQRHLELATAGIRPRPRLD